MSEWISTKERLPEEGRIVETRICDEKGERNRTTLKREGKLWFFPDGSMYVYYTPTHWKPLFYRRKDNEMDKQKERLKEFLNNVPEDFEGKRSVGVIADHLLANGVIVPPCKVGTTVYEAIWQKNPTKFSHFRKLKVVGFHMGDFPDLRGKKRDNYLVVYFDVCGHIGHIPFRNIGKTVFFEPNLEEAEKGRSRKGADNEKN